MNIAEEMRESILELYRNEEGCKTKIELACMEASPHNTIDTNRLSVCGSGSSFLLSFFVCEWKRGE